MAEVLERSIADQSRIGVFDTSICTDNLGDCIIMDAVWDVIHEIFGSGVLTDRIATHRFMSRDSYRLLPGMRIGIVGGTNILKAHMFVRANWKLRLHDAFRLRNAVLLGVGWQQYQGRLDVFSRLLLGRVLSREFMHSVRDRYTLERLRGHVRNMEYTACPTLWPLTPARCAAIARLKAPEAIVSLTYYRPDPCDAQLVRLLLQEYGKVHFWCQMREDLEYLNSLDVGADLPVIDDVGVYTQMLRTREVDVIGTRLHGGIRALQCGRRALILAVDNRATELARDSGIPVVDRRDMSVIAGWIRGSAGVTVDLPWDAIAAWKRQFSRLQ